MKYTFGLPVVSQQIPLAVTGLPPSDIILPPDIALIVVIPVTFSVITTDGSASSFSSQENIIEIMQEERIITSVLSLHYILAWLFKITTITMQCQGRISTGYYQEHI